MPTKHNSDELYIRTETKDHDARDATLTLNMFKIKKDLNEDESFAAPDQFFAMAPTEVENLFLPPSSADSVSNKQNFFPMRKSYEPVLSEFQVCQTNVTGTEEFPVAADATSGVFAVEGTNRPSGEHLSTT